MKYKFNFKIVYTSVIFLCGFMCTVHGMNNMSVMERFESKFFALHKHVKTILNNDDLQSFGHYIVAAQQHFTNRTGYDWMLVNQKEGEKEFNKHLYSWLLEAKITEKDVKIKIDQSFSRDGYYFFSGDKAGFSLSAGKDYEPLQYLFIKNSGFSGIEMRIIYPKVTVGTDDLRLALSGLVKKNIETKILSTVTSVYKIHLMPTEECIYPIVLELIDLINSNPKIAKDISFLDFISNIKVLLDTNKKREKNEAMPIIVMYVSVIFLSEDHRSILFSKDVKDEEKLNLLEHNYTEWVDYKKAKKCTKLLLQFLISYFKDKKHIKGSGITPRFNQKVTDLIYFAQGHGDDKKTHGSTFFDTTKNKIYFKNDITGTQENYEINVDALFQEQNTCNVQIVACVEQSVILPAEAENNIKIDVEQIKFDMQSNDNQASIEGLSKQENKEKNTNSFSLIGFLKSIVQGLFCLFYSAKIFLCGN